MNFTDEELSEIGNQLACPTGENGIQMAELMNQTNRGMILKTIELLGLKNADSVLEIGPGNCAHLPDLFDMVDNLFYCGLEISPTMINEAKRRHKQYLLEGRIKFDIYEGLNLPYKESIFHKILSVNTLYFWQKPLDLLNQIHRVMKEGGVCTIAFAQKKFMKDLPFVHQKFTLYDTEDFSKLVNSSTFRKFEIREFKEEIISKDQDKVQREYSVAILEK